jgi:hypothetical protein
MSILWNIVIEFKDGAYETEVIAETDNRAYALALQDARMGSAQHPLYIGPVVAKFITKAKKQPTIKEN